MKPDQGNEKDEMNSKLGDSPRTPSPEASATGRTWIAASPAPSRTIAAIAATAPQRRGERTHRHKA